MGDLETFVRTIEIVLKGVWSAHTVSSRSRKGCKRDGHLSLTGLSAHIQADPDHVPYKSIVPSWATSSKLSSSARCG